MSKNRNPRNPIDESNEILKTIKKGGNPFNPEVENEDPEGTSPLATTEPIERVSPEITESPAIQSNPNNTIEPESVHDELEEEEEDVSGEEEIEPEMLPSKFLVVYNEKAQPTTINITRLDFFSALSKGEVEEHVEQSIRERHDFMRAGVMAVFKNTNEGVLFFGIDHSILDDYVREYEASFE